MLMRNMGIEGCSGLASGFFGQGRFGRGTGGGTAILALLGISNDDPLGLPLPEVPPGLFPPEVSLGLSLPEVSLGSGFGGGGGGGGGAFFVV